jgi:hypothetical protein
MVRVLKEAERALLRMVLMVLLTPETVAGELVLDPAIRAVAVKVVRA